ncbi:ketoacyl-ACP synthase III [Frankia sp. AgPm24]|uniref:beta-ketoacyl-ACP synthase III n=1 Tax=Frankia sp. AgPm24 TaxID=631128 RepID=UPI00200E6514|nr:beta-ketoacyl-ACP synthase III [Frankia sp. AgPm24]MCK9921358.1 ketoacyl-ACP synthase III [Frankia sp. AgPm24]
MCVAVLAGVGGDIPAGTVTNDDLAARFDTSDAWITGRTGIRTRHVIGLGESTSDLAVRAGAAALASAGMSTVGAVIVATTTPDRPCPATAPVIAARLGLGPVPAFDLGAVCSGFVYGLAAAQGLIASGLTDSVLLIGADTFSTILDPDDRSTRAVFGDGAGAVVLRAGSRAEAGALLAFDLGSDGTQEDLITVRAGGSRAPHAASGPPGPDRWFSMRGQVVYRHAVQKMAASARAVLADVGWSTDAVDLFIAHQANERILTAVGDELGIPSRNIFVHLTEVGNTAAASIPLALSAAWAAGRLRPHDRILLTAFGGGTTWGSVALVWPEIMP